MIEPYETWFKRLVAASPHAWQSALGGDAVLRDRLIRIPTGFGKTAGTILAWLWNRMVRTDVLPAQREAWPRRVAFCLPMRVLVEQTEAEVRRWLKEAGLLWDGHGDHHDKVGVHVLMGGTQAKRKVDCPLCTEKSGTCDAGSWHLYPEHPAILIGTQDMLLSRALNRGYACGRARWPMEFGLLNQDCLWILDEVQLMDVGLATSAQLQAFREQDRAKPQPLGLSRPCQSWWMSATMQPEWLGKSPETSARVEELMRHRIAIPAESRTGDLWQRTRKPAALETFADEKAIAKRVAGLHAQHRAEGITLVVMNTVDRAVKVAAALRTSAAAADIRLIHSRFRPAERKEWAAFLQREACVAGSDRIIVATQVIEAGVDISARVLVTELAPWPNLVQRFGRAARWANTNEATVIVADLGLSDKKTAPYDAEALQAARDALGHVPDVAPLHLERFEEEHPDLLPKLYPYEPKHLLLRRELDDLFDTTPDLSGADVDISRFIRSGDERDVQVFWADIAADAKPADGLRAIREALCSVPFLKAADWLCGDKKGSKLKDTMRAWVWNWLDGEWRRCERRDCWPGQTILVAASCGGYVTDAGWSPESSVPVTPPHGQIPEKADPDETQDDEAMSAYAWRTIATHGGDVANEIQRIGAGLESRLAALLHLAGRWHDAGKAHPAFQKSIKHERSALDRPERQDLAKAPKQAWLPLRELYPVPPNGRRPGFRHELASTLALFAVLRRHHPDHPALLGPWRELLEKSGRAVPPEPTAITPPNPLEQELLALSADDFDLLAYLVCSHHGKVRMTWHACPADQAAADPRLRIRGIRDQDELPVLPLMDASGGIHDLPASILDLAPAAAGLDSRFGRGWTERVLDLLQRHGPFRLAWLEACLRAADMRASRIQTVDQRVGIIRP